MSEPVVRHKNLIRFTDNKFQFCDDIREESDGVYYVFHDGTQMWDAYSPWDNVRQVLRPVK